ncbi:LacI family DNA-binding transcriptional regulator [Streptomyces sp. NPDC060194]|uniref:LacI family DNA-binding transcriptional regulator n=1 Tax=Streptomyces sp. NPDC060194 TaxID=3347069 RepID=UPI0036673D33
MSVSDSRPRPTISDVASKAGVAIGTASKALSGSGQLRAETRERVLASARELGYQPNSLAKSLQSGRTYTVGLMTSDSVGRFNQPLMLGINDALGAGRMSVFLCDARGDGVREQYFLDSLIARQVDGIIVTGWRTDHRPPLGGDRLGVPVVYAYAHSADPADVSVLPDDEHGGRLVGEHLVATGRRRIAVVTGPVDYEAVPQREAGLRAALADAGLEPLPGQVLHGDWSESWGREAVDILLSQQTAFDAVFCGSDQIARGVADQLRDRGVKVPTDVALVGFDNWEVFAETTRPPLTSIDMNMEELGRVAARRLLDLIDGTPRSGVERLPCRIVVRESSRPSVSSLAPSADETAATV